MKYSIKRRIAIEFLLLLTVIVGSIIISSIWSADALHSLKSRIESDSLKAHALIQTIGDSISRWETQRKGRIEKTGQWEPPIKDTFSNNSWVVQTDSLISMIEVNSGFDKREMNRENVASMMFNSRGYFYITIFILFIIFYPVRGLIISVFWAVRTIKTKPVDS